MSFEKLIRIPNDRIGALIGRSGKTKKKIEDICSVQLDIDSDGGEVVVKSEKINEKVQPFKAIEIVSASGRGFSPENAVRRGPGISFPAAPRGCCPPSARPFELAGAAFESASHGLSNGARARPPTNCLRRPVRTDCAPRKNRTARYVAVGRCRGYAYACTLEPSRERFRSRSFWWCDPPTDWPSSSRAPLRCGSAHSRARSREPRGGGTH